MSLHTKVIWVDVETTGREAADNTIIELAALYEDGRSGFIQSCH